MTYLIIDGYNLIGTYHRDLEAQRNKLIESLIRYRERKGHRIILVFDGWKSGGVREEHMERGGIRIIYSRLGEKADSVIKRIISTERQEWIVITSDRDIASEAWRCGSIPVPSEVFYEKVIDEDRFEAEGSGFEEIWETGLQPAFHKGNPYRLSKKERAIRRAISKL
ncbi:MAG: NYN domain-containing protein [Thermodesulfovibrionales bacterium]